MSFLFKSKPKNPNPNALPSASRDIRSSDGTTPVGSSSQIPTLNGVVNGNAAAAKPGSPTPGTSVNNSLNSLAGNESGGSGSRPGTAANVRPSQDEKAMFVNTSVDETRSPGPPSPEQKSIRSGSHEAVRCL